MNNQYEILKEICTNRKSVREFTGKLVCEEDIEKIKEIAYTAPYASGRKNWELVIVDDKTVIKEMAVQIRMYVNKIKNNLNKDFKDEFLSYSKSFTNFESAPLLIIPTYRISRGMEIMFDSIDDKIKEWERDNFVKSISCAMMLVLLAAESLGLAACPMTGPLIAETEIAKVVKIKKGRTIGAVIPVGYVEKKNGKH